MLGESRGEGVLWGWGGGEVEDGLELWLDEVRVESGVKRGIVEIVEEGREEKRRVGKSVGMGGCLEVRGGGEFEKVGDGLEEV